MFGLELQKRQLPSTPEIIEYYWNLDMRGVFLESELYQDKEEAIYSLVSNTIKWTSISIDCSEM